MVRRYQLAGCGGQCGGGCSCAGCSCSGCGAAQPAAAAPATAMAGGPYRSFHLRRPGLGDVASDLGSIINPAWLQALQPTDLAPLSDPAPVQPLSVISPSTPNPFVSTYTLDPNGNMIQASPDLANPFGLPSPGATAAPTAPAASEPNWLWIGGGALVAVVMLAGSSRGRR